LKCHHVRYLAYFEPDTLSLSTIRLQHELEKAACIVAIAGNAVYLVACSALVATLARLTADAKEVDDSVSEGVRRSGFERLSSTDRSDHYGRYGWAGGVSSFHNTSNANITLRFNSGAALWACAMDVLQAQKSMHRGAIKEEPMHDRTN
jgi:hypothetical protein